MRGSRNRIILFLMSIPGNYPLLLTPLPLDTPEKFTLLMTSTTVKSDTKQDTLIVGIKFSAICSKLHAINFNESCLCESFKYFPSKLLWSSYTYCHSICLVNPDTSFLTPKEGLGWNRQLLNLVLEMFFLKQTALTCISLRVLKCKILSCGNCLRW